METVIFILIVIIGVMLTGLILNLSQDTEQPDTHHKPGIILTDHACERMEERLGIYGYAQMQQLAQAAFVNGKSYHQLNGYLYSKLYNIETNSDGPRIARFYENTIFVFSDDGVLITLFKNEPYQKYH